MQKAILSEVDRQTFLTFLSEHAPDEILISAVSDTRNYESKRANDVVSAKTLVRALRDVTSKAGKPTPETKPKRGPSASKTCPMAEVAQVIEAAQPKAPAPTVAEVKPVPAMTAEQREHIYKLLDKGTITPKLVMKALHISEEEAEAHIGKLVTDRFVVKDGKSYRWSKE